MAAPMLSTIPTDTFINNKHNTSIAESNLVLDQIVQGFYLIFGFLGLAGNGLVLVVMFKVRSLRSITNLFIANQSVIDFASSLLLLCQFYNPGHKPSVGTEVTPWNRFKCYFWESQFIFWALLACSTFNLTTLTLERFVAVVFPVFYRNRASWRVASCAATFPWIMGFAITSYWPAIHHLQNGLCFPNFPSQTFRVTTGIFLCFVKLFLPVLVMVCVYLSILRKVKASSTKVGNKKKTNTSELKTSTDRSSHGRIRVNILKTLLLVTLMFVVCWTPNQILFFVYNLGAPVNPRGTFQKLSVVFLFVNVWINPFIYTFKYRNFQRGLIRMFHIGRRKRALKTTSTQQTK